MLSQHLCLIRDTFVLSNALGHFLRALRMWEKSVWKALKTQVFSVSVTVVVRCCRLAVQASALRDLHLSLGKLQSARPQLAETHIPDSSPKPEKGLAAWLPKTSDQVAGLSHGDNVSKER